jgi:hypothetical protein
MTRQRQITSEEENTNAFWLKLTLSAARSGDKVEVFFRLRLEVKVKVKVVKDVNALSESGWLEVEMTEMTRQRQIAGEARRDGRIGDLHGLQRRKGGELECFSAEKWIGYSFLWVGLFFFFFFLKASGLVLYKQITSDFTIAIALKSTT